MSLRRQSSLLAAKRIRSQAINGSDEPDETIPKTRSRPQRIVKNDPRSSPDTYSTASSSSESDSGPDDHVTSSDASSPPPAKRRKTTTTTAVTASRTVSKPIQASKSAPLPRRKTSSTISLDEAIRQLFPLPTGTTTTTTRTPSSPLRNRPHTLPYHRPLLLDPLLGPPTRTALLTWFDSVSHTRRMPWRKPWIDPSTFSTTTDLRTALAQRAYEVWISEIMLQQTRVATVIGYYTNWLTLFPTIHALAAASPDAILSAWRGLGYYSRATRIHEAAKKVCADDGKGKGMRGLLPADAAELAKEVPGVGRYTAGAISAIVFGRAEAMVDGNVLRVLSRQLGVRGDVKGDRVVIEVLWAAAKALVEVVARGGDEAEEEIRLSDRPGRWGQALMELGSTVCTPKPNCEVCPVTATCRAYGEGRLLAVGKNLMSTSTETAQESLPVEVTDIESVLVPCSLCEPLTDDEGDIDEIIDQKSKTQQQRKQKPRQSQQQERQATLSAFSFTSSSPKPSPTSSAPEPSPQALQTIQSHAARFPLKVIKKAIRSQETLVCAIRSKPSNNGASQYLISKRPEKGLLAGLWEFPSLILPDINDTPARERQKLAQEFVSTALGVPLSSDLRYLGELGSVPWVFSHLKLTMHVQLFEVSGEMEDAGLKGGGKKSMRRWATGSEVEDESMGTGMRQCWSLVKESLII